MNNYNRFVLDEETSTYIPITDNNSLGVSKNHNPNHDPSNGRFTSGPGGVKDTVSDSDVEKFYTLTNKRDGDMYRSDHLERVAKKLGNNKKPKISKTTQDDSTVLHRTWTKNERDSYINDENPRLSIGIYGSGLYFSTSRDSIKSYDRGVWSKAYLDKTAKIADIRDINIKMFSDRDKWTQRFQAELSANSKIRDPLKRVEEGMKIQEKHQKIKTIFTDSGIYASILGYDAISASQDNEIIVLNRGKVHFLEDN